MEAGSIDRREILRYLGYRGQEAEAGVKALVEECVGELFAAVRPRHLVREFPLALGDGNVVDGCCFRTSSRNLAGNLRDCDEILVFAATLGTEADQLIQKYNRLQMSKAVVMQAAAAAVIEKYCDEVCGELRREYEEKGRYLRPRFSPGYGDFSLDCQPALLGALEAGKRIGIKLTDSLVMVPFKSVSAVMGVSGERCRCDVKGCEGCGKADCGYRR